MRFLLLLLGLGLTLGAEPALALQTGLAGYVAEPGVDARSAGLHCDRSADDSVKMNALLATATKLWLPPGCVVNIGSGNGSPALTPVSNSTIECADGTAGISLARQYCSSGSDTPGAACTTNGQCANGTCTTDPGGPFASSSGSTYVLLSAAASTTGLTIKNCSIWANGGSGTSPGIGGAGKRWGYCDGAGTSTAGEGCYYACNSSSGALEGSSCSVNGDCGAGSCIARAGLCKSLSGACTAIPYATNWGASGPGKINVISWANAAYARVENVTIYDHRRGDLGIQVGLYGSVIGSNESVDSLTTNQFAGVFGPTIQTVAATRAICTSNDCTTASVSKGIIAGVQAVVERSTGYGWDAGIQALGSNVTVSNSVGGALGDAQQSGWNGTTDMLLSADGAEVQGFRGIGGLYCVAPDLTGYNFLIGAAFCDFQVGPKFIIQNSGNQYTFDRGAWSGLGAVMGLGDQRGRCSAGTRSGKVCVFGSGSNSLIGCSGGTCSPHVDFKSLSVNHFTVGGPSLIHSDQGADVTYFRVANGKRCQIGADVGKFCSSDGDCATGTCDFNTYTNGVIDGALFYAGANNTAIDLSGTAVGVNKTAALGVPNPSIQNWIIAGVNLHNFTTGVAFPSAQRVCSGGTGTTNDGTNCATASDCTCTGGGCVAPTCTLAVSNFVISGNAGTCTTPLSGWDWGFGDVSGLKGLLPSDDQCTPITLTAGADLTRGMLVSAQTSGSNTVVKTTTANPERSIGVVLGTVLSGEEVKVCASGTAVCIAQGAVTAGDILKPSGSTAGSMATVSGSSDLIEGSALASASNGATFRCAIGMNAGIQNTTQTFPKFAEAHAGSNTGSALCASAATVATISAYSATSGRSIRLEAFVPLDITGSVTRVFTTFITRGGSSCTASSPVTLVTADTEATANQNMTAAIAATDTGQSGSVTYRLCLCSDTAASAQANTGAALLLTEY